METIQTKTTIYFMYAAPVSDLSCLCLVARARCSSSMMQLGGSCECRAPRWGDPVGVEILPLNREPWGSLGRVKFLGKVAGDFFTGTEGVPGEGKPPHEIQLRTSRALYPAPPVRLTVQAAQSSEQFDWQFGWRRGAGSFGLGSGHFLFPFDGLHLSHRLLVAGVAQRGALVFSIFTLIGISSHRLWIFSHILYWNETSAVVKQRVCLGSLCLHLVDDHTHGDVSRNFEWMMKISMY